MINFWKLSYETVKEKRDQYKAENEKLRERNKKLEKLLDQKVRRNVRGGLQQMKIEDLESKHDSMKTENEQLKEELLQSDYVKASVFSDREEYKKQIVKLQEELETTEQKNVGLKLMNESSDKQLEIFHRCFNSLLTKLDINKDKDNLLSEISQHIGNKPSSSKYKYFREKLDGIGIKEDE